MENRAFENTVTRMSSKVLNSSRKRVPHLALLKVKNFMTHHCRLSGGGILSWSGAGTRLFLVEQETAVLILSLSSLLIISISAETTSHSAESNPDFARVKWPY